MPTYQTRMMVAQADFAHGNVYLKKGDTFVATQIDADYYAKRGRATFHPDQPEDAKPAAVPAAPVAQKPAPRRGRPPAAAKAATASSVVTTQDLPGEQTKEVETKEYADGTTVTGTAPLPDQSPAEQDAAADKTSE